MDEQRDYLPISMLNQLEYCERRFYLMHVRGEMEINAHVLEGTLRHENAHTPGTSREGETLVYRKLYIWSDELMISGFADIVEGQKSPVEGQNLPPGALIPVEYKKGRMGKWLNDHVQLCAQALCIAERSGAATPKGFIFYFGSRHREEVLITPELRARTAQSIRRAHEIVAAGTLPAPLENYNKCRDCSLEPICLPREIKILKGENQ
jgi:CRISPR-associated exonuclease Cas4